MRRAEKKYEAQELTVLWIGHQDRIPKLTKYAKDHGIPYYLYDPDDSFSRKFGINYGGGMAFINSDGIVMSRTPKAISASSLEAAIQKILPAGK